MVNKTGLLAIAAVAAFVTACGSEPPSGAWAYTPGNTAPAAPAEPAAKPDVVTPMFTSAEGYTYTAELYVLPRATSGRGLTCQSSADLPRGAYYEPFRLIVKNVGNPGNAGVPSMLDPVVGDPTVRDSAFTLQVSADLGTTSHCTSPIYSAQTLIPLGGSAEFRGALLVKPGVDVSTDSWGITYPTVTPGVQETAWGPKV